jgi:hypothetical protein
MVVDLVTTGTTTRAIATSTNQIGA